MESQDPASSGTAPPSYPKKPKLTKKERRELQEKQKAAKAAKTGKAVEPTQKSIKPPEKNPGGDKRSRFDTSGSTVRQFSHLSSFSHKSSKSLGVDASLYGVHHTAVALGLQFADPKRDLDANERCLALLDVIKEIVKDYTTPPGIALKRDLPKKIGLGFQFLTDCRPHSISMGNAMQVVRNMITNLDDTQSDEEAIEEIISQIDEFIKVRITIAGEMIARTAETKISHGDVILVYGRCEVVLRCLSIAAQNGKRFHVVVCDSAPDKTGRKALESLTSLGIPCTYVLLNACAFACKSVTKVLLGASAIMSNGTVYSRVGTALVAMTAAARHVPIIFCCETYKLCDRVQLDSIVNNVLGDPELVAGCESGSPLEDWKQLGVKILNIQYDITPVNLVGSIITEVGMIPPTAVPALIREYRKEDGAVQNGF